jgi:two-component system phosphate regulon sensor histidine kinase PhoR
VKTVWLRTALLAAGLGVVLAIVGLALGWVWALATLAAGLALLLVHHVANLAALAAWLRGPLRAEVPMGTGQWEDVFTALYRLVRGTLQHQHRLTAQLARFRSAAQAMPDAVIVLDAEDHISWCNTTAERYFGLDAQKDIGQPILNLVRQPDFAEYMRRGEYAEPRVATRSSSRCASWRTARTRSCCSRATSRRPRSSKPCVATSSRTCRMS